MANRYPTPENKGAIVDTIKTGGVPLGVAVSKKSGMVVVRDASQKITVLNNAEDKGIKSSFEIEYLGSGITFTKEDNILVTDERNQQVLEFTLEGTLIKPSALATRQYVGQFQTKYLQGITVHPSSGKVFIADTNNHCIHILKSDLTSPQAVGTQAIGGNWQGTENGFFNAPLDIACDSHDRVYVADCKNNRVQVFTQVSDGRIIHKFNMPKSPEQPAGIAIDLKDTVYIRSGKDGSVSVFNTERQLINTFGRRAQEAAPAFGFVGIAVGNSGELLVCDDSNNCAVIY